MSELPCASVSKRVLVQNLSYENEFDLLEKELAGGTHLHIKWFYTKTRFDTEAKDNSEMAFWHVTH